METPTAATNPQSSGLQSRSLQSLASRSFWLDLRTLALFRIGFGLIILSSLLVILPDFGLLYTDHGIFPRELAVSQSVNSAKWSFLSLHFASSSTLWAYGLYALTIIAAICFTVGLYTRWATPVLYLLFLSHMGRNVWILYGFDRISLVFLFWAIFLPLDRHFSILPRSKNENQSLHTLSSLASAAFILQIAMIYLHAGVSKYGFEWTSGTALRTTLHNDVLATALGRWARDRSWITAPLTYATLAIEVLAPLMVMLPSRTVVWRVCGCLLLFLLHLGIALTMDLAWFPYACSVAVLAPMPFGFFLGCAARVRSCTPYAVTRMCGAMVRAMGGALTQCGTWIAEHEVRIAHSVRTSILSAALVGSLVFFTAIVFQATSYLPPWFYNLATGWGFGQEWSFFAPNPRNIEHRYIVKGTFADGSVYDITWGTKEPLDFSEEQFRIKTAARLRAAHWHDDIFKGEGAYARKLCSNLCLRFAPNMMLGEAGLTKIDVYSLAVAVERDGKRLASTPNLVWYWNCGG